MCAWLVTYRWKDIISIARAVRLSWLEVENVYSRPLFARTILTHTINQTDLVFGVLWGFPSRSVCARLQVCVRIGYVFATLVDPVFQRFICQLVHSHHTHLQCKFRDRRSVICGDHDDDDDVDLLCRLFYTAGANWYGLVTEAQGYEQLA